MAALLRYNPALAAQPAVVPGADTAQEIKLVHALADGMPLTRVDNQFGGNAVFAQGAMEADGLGKRHPRIFLAMQDQHGRFCLADKGDRAKAQVIPVFQAVPGDAAAQFALEIGDIAGHGHHAPVADARTHDGSFETSCLRDGPGSHETALAPTANAEPLRVGDATLDS